MVDGYLDLRVPLTRRVEYWQQELLQGHRRFTKWNQLLQENMAFQQIENLCEDKVNPKVFKYLGYAYSENGNPEGAIKSLSEYMSKVDAKKVNGKDYLYLAKAKLATSMDDKGIVSNQIEGEGDYGGFGKYLKNYSFNLCFKSIFECKISSRFREFLTIQKNLI